MQTFMATHERWQVFGWYNINDQQKNYMNFHYVKKKIIIIFEDLNHIYKKMIGV